MLRWQPDIAFLFSSTLLQIFLFFPPQKSKLQLFSAWSSVVQQTWATEQNQSDLLLICVSEMLLHYFCSCFTGRIRHLKDRSGATLVSSVLQKKKNHRVVKATAQNLGQTAWAGKYWSPNQYLFQDTDYNSCCCSYKFLCSSLYWREKSSNEMQRHFCSNCLSHPVNPSIVQKLFWSRELMSPRHSSALSRL